MRSIIRVVVLLVGAVLVAGSTTAASGATATRAGTVTAQVASPDVLVIAPGKIGTLKMGASKARAKDRGWIRYEGVCGWGAGRRAYRLDADGDEVFKSYPDKVTRSRVLSFHAMGQVLTSNGIWAARGIGKQSERLGSTLDQIAAAYPDLKHLGDWQDYLTGEWWPVYRTGSKKAGWLDFYIDPSTNTAIFSQVRAPGVRWGQPSFGC